MARAERSLRTAVRMQPDDAATLISLGHVTYMRGDHENAFQLLASAAELAPTDAGALRSLIEMYRLAGRTQAAMEAARELTQRVPDDVPAWLELAELQLRIGNLDDAVAAFTRLREVDAEPGHAVYAVHGMIEVELRRDQWRRALDLAITATGLDRHQLTTDVLAFVSAQLFGEVSGPVPERETLESRLAQRRAEHRMFHVESLA